MAKTDELELTWNGELVTVSFSFNPGCPGSYEEPPEPASIDIESVFWHKKNVDIADILSSRDLEEIKKMVLEQQPDDGHEEPCDFEYEPGKDVEWDF